MKEQLTKEDILEMIAAQARQHAKSMADADERAAKFEEKFQAEQAARAAEWAAQRAEEAESRKKAIAEEAESRKKALAEEAESRKKALAEEAESRKKALAEEAESRKKAIAEEAESRKKADADFEKKLGQLGGKWGQFVEEMVQPKIIEMFRAQGVEVSTAYQRVKGVLNGERYYEVDLLAVNGDLAVAVEIKTTLGMDDVREHLKRMEKMCKVPPPAMNLSGYTLLGAVAGIILEPGVADFAYRKGLFVLRQNGNLLDVANDAKFKPKEWKTEY